MTTATLNHVRPIMHTTSAVRFGAGVVFSLMSTALLVLAFPPYNVWPLAFFAFVPAFIAEYHFLPRRWSGLGSAVSVGGWLAIFLTAAFGGGKYVWMFLGIAMLVGLFGILSLPAIRKFHERTRFRWFILQGALDYAGLEMIRSFIPPINTHAFMAQTMYSQRWLVLPISIFSIYGLTLVLMLVNFALAQGALMYLDNKWHMDERPEMDKQSVARWMATAAVVFALWAGIGLVTLAGAPSDASTIRVSAVQHGFAKAGHMDLLETQTQRLQILSEQTRIAAGQGAQLVLWPELGLGFDPQVEHTAELKALAAETDTYILIGYGVGRDASKWRNEAVMLTPSGEFLAVYGKTHATSPTEPPIITSGTFPVYDTVLGPLATLICNDINYTDVSRILTRNGARLITMPALEARSVPGWEQRSQVILRAVENRVSFVKVDSAGLGMIVDPYGRIVAQKTSTEPYALVADVPLGAGDTLYSKYLGDWIGWVALAGMVIFSVAINKKQKGVSK
jgi:apolipoprotein N-acyltransferase